VWNFERTEYTFDEPKDTEVTLLTSTPRVIESITEYYTTTSGDGEPPEKPDWGDNMRNEPPVIPVDWKTDRPPVAQGDSLWNCEVIKYAAVDANGKNLYESQNIQKSGLIVMGSESFGISKEIEEKITSKLLIPPYPADAQTSESLNVAIATAIICAEFRRP
jgi:hypothetical protein